MPDVFLSYSRDDQTIARRFAGALEREGFSVWWDQALNPGETFDQVTSSALKGARAVVVLWSGKSVESRWVRSEATLADRYGTLLPVMIEPCERPIQFELTHTADLTGWGGSTDEAQWRSFIDSLRRFVERAGGTPQTAQLAPAQLSPATLLSTPTPAPPGRSHPRLALPIVVICVLAALLFGAALAWLVVRQSANTPVETEAAVSPATPAGTNTLAVLPFADLSEAGNQEYFSDGLTEEILNQLAQVRELTVTGRTSSFSFKGKNEDLRDIAQKLGVANLLEGSVRREGNQLRITAQLIDGMTGAHLWSKTYARELSGVFALQEEIAKDVARALSITLDVGALPRAEGGTTNIEAYDKFLQARASLQSLGDGMNDAVRLYREATELDPQFWSAWYGLAVSLVAVPTFFPERAEAARQELVAVRSHVLENAPDSWTKQALLAGNHFEERNWAEYEAAANAAQSNTSPAAALDLIGLGFMRLALGRTQEALEILERASRAEPLAVGPSAGYQLGLFYSGQVEAAEREYIRSKSLPGEHFPPDVLSLTRLMLDPAATLAAIDSRHAQLSAQYPIMAPGRGLFLSLADPVAARATAVALLERPDFQNPSGWARTAVYADLVGDKDTALAALQRFALASGRELIPLSEHFVIWSPFRTGLRADPRFKQIVRDLGLIDYWRTTGNWGDFCKPVGEDDFECK